MRLDRVLSGGLRCSEGQGARSFGQLCFARNLCGGVSLGSVEGLTLESRRRLQGNKSESKELKESIAP